MKISFNFRKSLILLFLSSLSMLLMNCSKSDSDASTPTAQIVGTWKVISILVKEGTKPEADQFPAVLLFFPCFKDVSFTFKSNGDLSSSVPTACQSTADNIIGTSGSAKYEVTGGKLIITDSDGTKTTEDVSFNGNQMTWASSETTSGIVTTTKVVLTKQ
jgi:hypothetical protein